jgi:hypothetical protein
MNVVLTEKQKNALESFGSESKLYLMLNKRQPIAYIHKRSDNGRKIGQIYFDFNLFNIMDHLGIVTFQHEVFTDFYTYKINKRFVKELLNINN